MTSKEKLIEDAVLKLEHAVSNLRHVFRDLYGTSSGANKFSQEASSNDLIISSDIKSGLTDAEQAVVQQVTEKHHLSSIEQKILSATAWLEQARPIEMHCTLIAALAGYSPLDNHFKSALQNLSSKELIIVNAEIAHLTKDGVRMARAEQEPLTTRMLVDRVCMQLPQQQRLIFSCLFEHNITGMKRSEIAIKYNLDPVSKSLRRDIYTLEKLGLIIRGCNNRLLCAEIIFLDSIPG